MWVYTSVADAQSVRPYPQLIHLETGTRVFVHQYSGQGDYYLVVHYPNKETHLLAGPCLSAEQAGALLSDIATAMISNAQIALIEPIPRYEFPAPREPQ